MRRRRKREQDQTIREDRPISAGEAAVVVWILRNEGGDWDRLAEGVRSLRVVGRCACGCASVDFEPGGQAGELRPIADAVGKDSKGRRCGVILWGRPDAITGLEVYECESDSATEVPAVETLLDWGSVKPE